MLIPYLPAYQRPYILAKVVEDVVGKWTQLTLIFRPNEFNNDVTPLEDWEVGQILGGN